MMIAALYVMLRWGSDLDAKSDALVSWCGNKVKRTPGRRRLYPSEVSATPTTVATVPESLGAAI